MTPRPQPTEPFDESQREANGQYLRRVMIEASLWCVIPALVHGATWLVARDVFQRTWRYTLAAAFVGSLVTAFVLFKKNRCPACEYRFGRFGPSRRRPHCRGCGARVL